MLEIADSELRIASLHWMRRDLDLDRLPKSLETLVTGVDPAGIQTTLVADVHTQCRRIGEERSWRRPWARWT